MHLEAGVAAYREALKVRTRDRVPLQWAITQNNLGNTLLRLGERESGTGRLEEAVAAYKAALVVFEPAKATHYIEITKKNLQHTKILLNKRRI
jgi:tetratricopeptide (TPR) repeat protein